MSSIFAGLVQCYSCNSAYKNGTVICFPCVLEHVCYEPFSLKVTDLKDILR